VGHEWLSTTTRYVHVRSDHIETWTDANQRVANRLVDKGRVNRCAEHADEGR
jgi:hypothetical protein